MMEKLRAGVLVKLLISYREKYVFDRVNGKYQIKLRNQKMKLYRLSVIIALLSCAIANANLIQNGDVEAWTAGVPDNWFYAVPAGTDLVTQVTGLDGTGSAAKLGSGDLKNNTTAIGAGEIFFLQFDFSYETGTGRTVNAVLRQISLGDDRGINVKVEGGSLYCYSSATGWVAVTGATGLAANNAYRVTVDGIWEGNYTVGLDDLTGGSNIVSGFSIAAWQNVSGPGITDSVNMNRSNTTVDWTFDNVVVTPEPASMALLGLGALLLRRRK